ncbi:DUF547 domain-containing protein [Neotamlana laminarinivorans]|uniref:DUF547 domain-containing protein n=1 Tax=Neotamlana laminarinivorans TaxID=2883124 RepID=A0A9X1I2K6_9FLAO|nr:DUF547 domain-containing protein [Tamlana laminarinivorans]MCB4799147.1 DUF547 domain-containing protein [Tamlana laminarinivorans]
MRILKFIIVFVITSSVYAQNVESFFKETNTFLQTYVKDGKVNYKAINNDPSKLNSILELAKNTSIDGKDANTYQAFWINAYNLSVIKGIIDVYPTKSPLDNDGFFDKKTHELAGKSITLNDIEHKLLRAKFKDPRFHFVLVCGAVGCPPLINKAYLPNTLNAQLEAQTKLAINGSFLMVNVKKKRIQASEIMKWYKEDFTMNGTTEIDFINKYRTEAVPANSKISYFPYNWTLNQQ